MTMAGWAAGAGDKLSHRAACVILLIACLAFSALRWLHLGTLWGDGSLWLFVSARAHGGEMPFRDFMSSYPPLSVWIFQGAFRLFGQTFITAQIVVDLISAAIVLMTYAIALRLMPRLLALLAALLLVGMSDTGFQLFSLQVYSAALLPGCAGLQMMTIGLFERRRLGGRESWATAALIVLGAITAILSKPEFMAGAVAALVAVIMLAAFRDDGRPVVQRILAATATPLLGCVVAFGIFALVGIAAGGSRMLEGLSGYGLAQITCPWWPTGLGLYGAVGSLGQAAAFLGLVSLVRLRTFTARYGAVYYAALAGAALGAVLYVITALDFTAHSQAALGYFATAQALAARFGLTPSDILGLAGYFLTKRNVFLPVVWVVIALAAVLTARLLLQRSRRVDPALYILLLMTCGLSARQLFGDYAEAYANVAIAAFPYLSILVVLFLYAALEWIFAAGRTPDSRAIGAAILVTLLLVGVYAAPRTAMSVVKERHAGYTPLHTISGTVALTDSAAAAIYSYVRDHSKPQDKILDIGADVGGSFYGGGINFALRRASPVGSTIFTDIQPPDSLMRDDLARFRKTPPKLVIATDPLQTLYGLPNAWNRCPFPALVWAPHAANFDHAKRIPVTEEIRAHYVKVYEYGRWAVFARR